MSEFVKLGFCRKVHGIRGEFQLTLLNHQETILQNGDEILIRPLAGSSLTDEKKVKITKLRIGNKAIAQLDQICDRNQAEALIPFDILFDRSFFPEASDDEFYLNDLIGCTCVTSDNNEIGKVIKIYDNTAQDILVIQTPKGSLEIPFVENFVHEIDIENQLLIISPPSYIES